MSSPARNVVILGSTGSIGRSALQVIAASSGRLKAFGLTANTRLEQLCRQACEFEPACVVATDPREAAAFDWSRLPGCARLRHDVDAMSELVSQPEVDVVLSAIVGSAGLTGTWAALEAGKIVALANKETLVMAGPLVMKLATERGAPLLPVDSEHNAVFQALNCGRR